MMKIQIESNYKPLCNESNSIGTFRGVHYDLFDLICSRLTKTYCEPGVLKGISVSFLIKYITCYSYLWSDLDFANYNQPIILPPSLRKVMNITSNMNPDCFKCDRKLALVMVTSYTIREVVRDKFNILFEDINKFLYDISLRLGKSIPFDDLVEIKRKWVKLGLAPLPEPKIWNPKLFFLYSDVKKQAIKDFLLVINRIPFCRDLIPIVCQHIID